MSPSPTEVNRNRGTKGRALSSLALYIDVSAQQLRKLPRKRQPAAASLHRFLELSLDLRPLLKNAFLIFRINAYSCVGNRQNHGIIVPNEAETRTSPRSVNFKALLMKFLRICEILASSL